MKISLSSFLTIASLASVAAKAPDTNITTNLLRGANESLPAIAQHRELNIRTNKRWKDRIGDVVQIPYRISGSLSSSRKRSIEDSIQELADRSHVIKFVPRTNQAAYINVVTETSGCWSYVGKIYTGKEQKLNFGESWCFSKGTIQHEFLHALGFQHEHNRPDRDQYVTIHRDNIKPKSLDNYDIDPNSRVLGAPYDYGSVLHYHRKASAIDGRYDTITPKDSSARIGQRDGASDRDILEVRLLYQCISGPRTLQEYERNPCTSDCKCWEGARGCGGNDAACQGDLVCSNDQCVKGGGGGGGGGSGCTDTAGWTDVAGDGCDWYSEHDPEGDRCEIYGWGNGNENSGITAGEACCVCGGGSLQGVTFLEFRNAETPDSCLDLEAASTDNGSRITLYPCNGTPAQHWWVDSNFYIRSALDTNKCIVGASGKTDKGTNLIINDCFANDDRFQIFYYTDDTFKPKNNEDVCMAPSRAKEVQPGWPLVHFWTCYDSDQYKWKPYNARRRHLGESKERKSKTPNNSRGLKQVKRDLEEDSCSDLPLGWYDAYGDNCLWYAEGTRCDDYGSANMNFGKTANQACCACGGGSNIALQDFVPQEEAVEATCWDSPGWTDSVGDSCTWYAQGENCNYYGDQFASELGNANEACCACGGGSSEPPPANDFFEAPGCSNSPSDWMDEDGDGCAFYAKDDRCELYGDAYVGVGGKTANEACCACGGGLEPTADQTPNTPDDVCSDSPQGWTDSDGDDCLFYAEEDNCEQYGDSYAGEDGKTANEACCVCGGGSNAGDGVAVSKRGGWAQWLPGGFGP